MTNANVNPLQDQLNNIANQAEVQAAQPIEQQVQAAQPVVAQSNYAVGQVTPAAPLTMDSNEVTTASAVSAFLKLRDGGVELDDAKFGAVKFHLVVDGAENGGSFRPCYCMNYSGPNGHVYTKSYDGVTTVSTNAGHNGLSWAENQRRILQASPNAYSYLGYELVLEVAEEVTSTDKKTTIPAGKQFGYTTPYLASKDVLALWKKWTESGKRGEKVTVEISGEEVSKGANQFKKFIISEV